MGADRRPLHHRAFARGAGDFLRFHHLPASNLLLGQDLEVVVWAHPEFRGQGGQLGIIRHPADRLPDHLLGAGGHVLLDEVIREGDRRLGLRAVDLDRAVEVVLGVIVVLRGDLLLGAIDQPSDERSLRVGVIGLDPHGLIPAGDRRVHPLHGGVNEPQPVPRLRILGIDHHRAFEAGARLGILLLHVLGVAQVGPSLRPIGAGLDGFAQLSFRRGVIAVQVRRDACPQILTKGRIHRLAL